MRRAFHVPICLLATALMLGCSDAGNVLALETIHDGPLILAVNGQGELKSVKATPLQVPGEQWAPRQLVWALPEGSMVKAGDLVARFTAEGGEMTLAQAMVDLERNALARAGKEGELIAGQGRVAVDLSQVATQLGIAHRYAGADVSTMARNDVLDAVQDVRYLGTKQATLQWKQGQFSHRGGAELAVLDAQRATYDINAQQRRSDLSALELRAPHAGVLVLTANWTGEKPIVGASLRGGFEFGSLPDTAAMEVEISLPQIEAQGIKAGDAVELFPAGRPEQKFISKLSWVASAAKVRSRDNPVKYLTMKAPVPVGAVRRYALLPGQGLQARVLLLQSADTLSVANVAVQGNDGKTYVQVSRAGGLEKRRVRLGARGTARSQVLAGLKAGEQVVLVDASRTGPDASATTGPAPDAQPVANAGDA